MTGATYSRRARKWPSLNTLVFVLISSAIAFLGAAPRVDLFAQQQVAIEKVSVEKLDEKLKKYVALRPWELLSIPTLKSLYETELSNKKVESWVRKLNVAGTTGMPYSDGKTTVVLYLGNKPHEGYKELRIVLDPEQPKLAGKITEMDERFTVVKRVIYFGTPTDLMKTVLDQKFR